MEGLIEKMTFKQRPEGGEGVNFMKLQGKSILGRGNHQFKGPEAGVRHTYLRSSKETNVARRESKISGRRSDRYQEKGPNSTGPYRAF